LSSRELALPKTGPLAVRSGPSIELLILDMISSGESITRSSSVISLRSGALFISLSVLFKLEKVVCGLSIHSVMMDVGSCVPSLENTPGVGPSETRLARSGVIKLNRLFVE